MSVTQTQLNTVNNKLEQIEKSLAGIMSILSQMQEDINSRVKLSDVSSIQQEIEAKVRTNAQDISSLQLKLAKVLLPEETRFYLDEGEVSDYQSNFAKLRAMMAKFDILYKNLVAYQATLNS